MAVHVRSLLRPWHDGFVVVVVLLAYRQAHYPDECNGIRLLA